MTKMGKVMIAVGLIWLFIWCLCGFYLGVLYEPYINEMKSLAEQGNLTGFWDTFSSWKSHAVAHSHALCFSFVLILIALSMPYIEFSDKTKCIIGLLLIIGVVLFGISDWFKLIPLIMIGGVLIVAMVLVSFIGVLRGIKK